MCGECGVGSQRVWRSIRRTAAQGPATEDDGVKSTFCEGRWHAVAAIDSTERRRRPWSVPSPTPALQARCFWKFCGDSAIKAMLSKPLLSRGWECPLRRRGRQAAEVWPNPRHGHGVLETTILAVVCSLYKQDGEPAACVVVIDACSLCLSPAAASPQHC